MLLLHLRPDAQSLPTCEATFMVKEASPPPTPHAITGKTRYAFRGALDCLKYGCFPTVLSAQLKSIQGQAATFIAAVGSGTEKGFGDRHLCSLPSSSQAKHIAMILRCPSWLQDQRQRFQKLHHSGILLSCQLTDIS